MKSAMPTLTAFQSGSGNGSLVPRTRGSNVPSASYSPLCKLNHASSAAALEDTLAVSEKRKRVKGTSSLASGAKIDFAQKTLAPGTTKINSSLNTFQPSERSSKTLVACNTGVTNPPLLRLLASQGLPKRPMKKITKHVDYLGMTYPSGTKPDETGLFLSWRRLEKAFKGYQFAQINDNTGAVWLYNIGQSNMGAHLQLSGTALSQLRINLKCDDYALIRQLTDFEGRASRIDIAINFHDCKITPMTAYRAFKSKSIQTPARSANYIDGIRDGIKGMTTYIGVRESDRYIRVYDKNGQMKKRPENLEAWVRLELEMKRVWARAAQNSIVQHGTEAAFNSHFSDYMVWNNREYNEALEGDTAPIDEVGRKESSAEKWLMKQVVPTLARTCHANPSFLATFMAAYRKALRTVQQNANKLDTDLEQGLDNALI